ncbi:MULTISPECIES: TetR/AcrR family transcriptional regulator [Bacillaceae]|uniref:TetR/AcrR family transcriptional regulator n=1 Tax=Shouchella oshimensis TaxID=290588 RepID=UPI0027D7A1A5|nr:TetR-like C-terminal domain-containing protein [Alkalicoccobacillus plakortidis]
MNTLSEKIDRRKQFTRMVLKEALMKLLKEKPISSVTVKELCEMANINRSTFYSHYIDAHDLLDKIGKELFDDMYATLNQYNFKKQDEVLQMSTKILEYVAERSEQCQILLSDNGDTSFKKRVIGIIQEFIMKKWMEEHQLGDDLSEYIPLLVVSGGVDTIESWLVNGKKESPQEMARLIHQFINFGLSGFRKK